MRGSELDQSLVNELQRLMLEAGILLANAEEKQITSPAVKEWLSDLQHLLFNQAEDIANEITTEALRSSLGVPPEPESLMNKALRESLPVAIRELYMACISVKVVFCAFVGTFTSSREEWLLCQRC